MLPTRRREFGLLENRSCRVGVVAASGLWHFGELGEETV
jgi:hypothetical protein